MPGIEQDKNAVMPLVSTQWLADHLEDPTVVILEVSIDPPTTADYAVGHIPGALFVYWKDLLWHESDREFPSTEVVAERLRALGVNDDTPIALVGDPFQFGAYAYWVMTMSGQEERCRLVDGGRRTWVAEKRPLVTDVAAPPIGDLTQGTADVSSRIGRDEVRAGLGPDGPLLVDMRSPEEYRGERVSPPWLAFDHGAERRGHIPGAHNLFIDNLLTDTGKLLPPEELRECFEAVGVRDDTEIVTYCRLSHRGSLAWFTLTRLLGASNVRVYDGSWTEWGSIVGFPVER
jgi:thiosulfate/3-mercaptopyruvate sulfurtransferase